MPKFDFILVEADSEKIVPRIIFNQNSEQAGLCCRNIAIALVDSKLNQLPQFQMISFSKVETIFWEAKIFVQPITLAVMASFGE